MTWGTRRHVTTMECRARCGCCVVRVWLAPWIMLRSFVSSLRFRCREGPRGQEPFTRQQPLQRDGYTFRRADYFREKVQVGLK